MGWEKPVLLGLFGWKRHWGGGGGLQLPGTGGGPCPVPSQASGQEISEARGCGRSTGCRFGSSSQEASQGCYLLPRGGCIPAPCPEQPPRHSQTLAQAVFRPHWLPGLGCRLPVLSLKRLLKKKIKEKGTPPQLKITAGPGFTPGGRWDLPRGEDLPHAADLSWLLWDADAFLENPDLKKNKIK